MARRDQGFTFRYRWWSGLLSYPEEVRARLVEAIVEYGVTGSVPELEGAAEAVFPVFKAEIDAEAERTAEIAGKRSEAGRAGGRPSRQDGSESEPKQNKQKKQMLNLLKNGPEVEENAENVGENKQNKQNKHLLSEKEKEKVSKEKEDRDIIPDKEKNSVPDGTLYKEKSSPETDEPLALTPPDPSPALPSEKRKVFKAPTEDEVREYMAVRIWEREYSLNAAEEAENFVNFYGSKGWMVGSNKMTDWKRAAARWLSEQEKSPRNRSNGTDKRCNSYWDNR